MPSQVVGGKVSFTGYLQPLNYNGGRSRNQVREMETGVKGKTCKSHHLRMIEFQGSADEGWGHSLDWRSSVRAADQGFSRSTE